MGSPEYARAIEREISDVRGGAVHWKTIAEPIIHMTEEQQRALLALLKSVREEGEMHGRRDARRGMFQ